MVSYFLKFSFILFLLVFTNQLSYAQEKSVKENNEFVAKNGAGLSAGFIGVYGAWAAYYERRIIPLDGFFSGLWFKGGGGNWVDWNNDGQHFFGVVTGMTGKKNHHLEMGVGIAAFYDREGFSDRITNASFVNPDTSKSDYWDYNIAPIIAYRYQKPKGGFVFRFGFAIPESIFLGIGVAF